METSRTARRLTLFALALITCVAFWGVTRAGWIDFDDPIYVTRNRHVNTGFTWDGIAWMFAHPHGGNFHPITTISHMLDVQVFGLDPLGPHAVNLLLHVANALLLCVVLANYTGAWWRSAIVAGLFAVHPLRVESVAWVSERKDVLSTLFFLLALEGYRRWAAAPSRRRYALLCVLYAVGLLAKPMLVTLPFILLLLDFWPLRRVTCVPWAPAAWPRWREKLPLFGLALCCSIATFLVQREAGAVMSSEALPLGARVLNALASYSRYLGATFAPVDLAVYYPNAGVGGLGLPALSSAILVVVSILALRQRESWPWMLVGWLWFVGTLVPVIGLVQVGNQSHADRYTYLPSIGLMILLVWTAAGVVERSPRLRSVVLVAAGVSISLCVFATAKQVALWKDTRTLFAQAVRVTSDNALANQVLGGALVAAGDVDAAIPHLELALRLVPDFHDAHVNLGSALGIQHRFEESVQHFQAALRVQDLAETRHNLGWAYEQMGRRRDAIDQYLAAIALDPTLPGPDAKLGPLLATAGRLDEAVVHLERAAQLAPEDIEVHRSVAIVRTMQGRVEEGIDAYRQVLKRSPSDPDALNNIAWIRATHRDSTHRNGAEAVRLAEQARDSLREPNNVILSTLAAAYAEAGRFEEAVHTGERAVQLARGSRDEDSARRFEAQLKLYRERQPLHQ